MKTQKELVVIKVIFVFHFSLYCCLSFGQGINDDDINIINLLWDRDDYNLNPENSTVEVLNIIKILKSFEIERNEYKIDSLKKSLNIIDSEIIENFKLKYNIISEKNKLLFHEFEEIFNLESYENLLSQEHMGEWSLLIAKVSSEKPLISISKPIYTKKKNWALVSYQKRNVFGILILYKDGDFWQEYKMINTLFLKPSSIFIQD
ncbi:hypothetical protein SCB49_06392 [unidentified eubacterium SCB49]|nr:hypothetical protein SCB49_06392 [unidentified eubacterium SCB49]